MIKLPAPNTAADRLLRQIAHGSPVTLNGIVHDPEVMPSIHSHRVSRLEKLLDELVAGDCLVVNKYQYQLTRAAQNYCDGIVAPVAEKYVGIPAEIRRVQVFTPPLQAKYLPSIHGRRDGSDDFRSVPSHFGGGES